MTTTKTSRPKFKRSKGAYVNLWVGDDLREYYRTRSQNAGQPVSATMRSVLEKEMRNDLLTQKYIKEGA